MKSNTLRGGFSENINLDSVSGTFDAELRVRDIHLQQPDRRVRPVVRAVQRSATAPSTKVAGKTFDVSGLSNAHVHGFAVANSTFNGVSDTSNTLKYVDNAKFTNVTVNGKPI